MLKTKNIKNEDQIDDFFDSLFKYQLQGNYIFRGISKKQEFAPSLFRNYEKISPSKSIVEYEAWLLEEYGKYANQYLPSFSNPVDFVAGAQHYGLPTRLIDWTLNPFVALYFAVHGSEKRPFKILMVNLKKQIYYDVVPIISSKNDDRAEIHTNNELVNDFCYFNQLMRIDNFGGTLWEKNFNLGEKYRDIIINKLLFLCSVYNSNPRLTAQNGLFQIPLTTSLKENRDLIISNCESITFINPKFRDYIIEKLFCMGLTPPKLFPDLQNICEFIKKAKL